MTPRPDDALPTREVSRMTGLSPTELRSLRRRLDGPNYIETPGGQARYLRRDVEQWIRERYVRTTGR